MELRQRLDGKVVYKILNNCSTLDLEALLKERRSKNYLVERRVSCVFTSKGLPGIIVQVHVFKATLNTIEMEEVAVMDTHMRTFGTFD